MIQFGIMIGKKKHMERCYKSDYCKNNHKCFAKHIATVNTYLLMLINKDKLIEL